MNDYIQVHDDYKYKVGIKNGKGEETGEFLEFDLMDTGLLLKLQDAQIQHKKNYQEFCQRVEDLKKEDEVKDNDNLISPKKEKELRLQQEFYKQEEKALDLFLGEGGTAKVLNGRKFNDFTFLQVVSEIQPIVKMLRKHQKNIMEDIKKKYANIDEDVLK